MILAMAQHVSLSDRESLATFRAANPATHIPAPNETDAAAYHRTMQARRDGREKWNENEGWTAAA